MKTFSKLPRASKAVWVFAPALLLCTALTGCIVVPAHPHHAAVVYVDAAPPPPQVEVYGAPPVVGQIWIGGYWNWDGNRHNWVPGHWDHARPGQYWVPHTWVRERNGWRMSEGHWDRR